MRDGTLITDAVRAAPGGLTGWEIAAATGLTPRVVRAWLASMEMDGQVIRERIEMPPPSDPETTGALAMAWANLPDASRQRWLAIAP